MVDAAIAASHQPANVVGAIDNGVSNAEVLDRTGPRQFAKHSQVTHVRQVEFEIVDIEASTVKLDPGKIRDVKPRCTGKVYRFAQSKFVRRIVGKSQQVFQSRNVLDQVIAGI